MILFLAFLPWPRLDRGAIATRMTVFDFSLAQRVAVAVLVAVQFYAVRHQFQVEPFVSNFPMYSGTFASPADYDAAMSWRTTRLEAVRGDERDIRPVVEALPDDQRIDLFRLAEHWAQGATTTPVPGPGRIEPLCQEHAKRASLPREVDISISRGRFDWTTGTFQPSASVPTGPVPLEAVCAETRRSGSRAD